MKKYLVGLLSLLMVLPAYAFDLPQGAVALTSPSQISQYKILGQFGTTGSPGSFLYGIPKASPTLGAIHFVQAQSFTLAGSGSSIGDTTLTLRSFNNVNGTPLNMSDFGEKGFGTIEPNNGTQQEQISFTSTTRNANGTVTLRGVSTVLNVYPYTATPGLAITHPGGVIFVLSNTVGLYDTLLNKYNNETVTGTYTFNNFPQVSSTSALASAPNQFVTLYQLGIATTTGCVNAGVATRGCVSQATDAMLQSSSSTDSTGAKTYANGDSFNQTSTPNKVPVANGSGVIDNNYINSTTLFNAFSSTTPTANIIPKTTASGTISEHFIATGTLQFDGAGSVLRYGSTGTYWATLGQDGSSSIATHAVDTVYSTPSTSLARARMVIVSLEFSLTSGQDESATLLLGSSSSTLSAAAYVGCQIVSGDQGASCRQALTFIVPPGGYYRISNTANSGEAPTIRGWYEINL